MAINKNLLLFIEPTKPPSINPILDKYTKKMVFALQRAKRGTYPYYRKIANGDLSHFSEGDGYFGTHQCSCGFEMVVNSQVFLYKDEITNCYAAHYLAWHRSEVPEEQLERVDRLVSDEEIKNFSIEKDIHHPGYNEIYEKMLKKKEDEDDFVGKERIKAAFSDVPKLETMEQRIRYREEWKKKEKNNENRNF